VCIIGKISKSSGVATLLAQSTLNRSKNWRKKVTKIVLGEQCYYFYSKKLLPILFLKNGPQHLFSRKKPFFRFDCLKTNIMILVSLFLPK
jgi:hypothetical protein